jgi:hypothetical protein
MTRRLAQEYPVQIVCQTLDYPRRVTITTGRPSETTRPCKRPWWEQQGNGRPMAIVALPLSYAEPNGSSITSESVG